MRATTLILVVGFGIRSFSAFRLTNWMAPLTAIVVAFALIVDSILLPALLLAGDRDLIATPVSRGWAIARAVDKRGEASARQMTLRALEQRSEGDKRLILFEEPLDVKGTACLVFAKKVGNDDQWLNLPALKRVKRIASNNKSGPFVDSEFAYKNLSSEEVEKERTSRC